MQYRRHMLIALLLVGSLRAEDAPKLPLSLHLDAGPQQRSDCLCFFELPESIDPQRPLKLVDLSAEKESIVPTQMDVSAKRIWWIVRGATKSGTKRTYRLESGTPDSSATVGVADGERSIEISFQGKSLLQYNKAHVVPPADLDPKYGRSAHLHPVRTPSGAMVTDEFPPDHAHQSGIFFAYTKTKFENRDVDFWNLAGGKGRVRFKELKQITSGPVYGAFQVQHEHIDLTAADAKSNDDGVTGGKVALIEDWEVRAWTAGWNSGYWLLDITSQIQCAGPSPLHLPEYHYGGMALRAARTWTPRVHTYVTSEGDDRLKGNHTRPKWCDVTGSIHDRPAGITLMTHPSNFRFPEPLRIHPTMPYMVYTPSFLGAWDIEPGKTNTSHYRFVIHDGELPVEKLNALWLDYAEPLEAKAVTAN